MENEPWKAKTKLQSLARFQGATTVIICVAVRLCGCGAVLSSLLLSSLSLSSTMCLGLHDQWAVPPCVVLHATEHAHLALERDVHKHIVFVTCVDRGISSLDTRVQRHDEHAPIHLTRLHEHLDGRPHLHTYSPCRPQTRPSTALRHRTPW